MAPRKYLLLLSILAFTNACATSRASSSKTEKRDMPSPITATESAESMTAKEVADFKELQTLFSKGAYESLLQKTLQFERRHPKSKQKPQLHNFRGLAYLLTRRPGQAIPEFEKSIQATQQPNFKQFVLYNLAVAQFESGQIDDAQQSVGEINVEALDRDTTVKYHFLKARIHAKHNLPLESAREILVLSQMLGDNPNRGPYVAHLDESLKNVSNTAALDSLYQEFEDAPLSDQVLFRIGSLEMANGQSQAGEIHLKQLLAKHPQSAHAPEATDLLRALQSQDEIEPMTVGVLLPMKGRFAKFGNKSLQGIELAFKIFAQEDPKHKITLVLEDSGEDADQAVKGLNNLFFKHHVAAVIGPLLSKGVDQVTQRAQELGIPLVTLTQQTGIDGDFVFQGGLTAQLQAQEVARYAIEKLGMKKFAILHPRDKYGEQYSQAYWDAVESLGGQIVGIESYNPGETDFRQTVDRLSGLYYTEARQREIEELARLREENKITKRNRKTEQFYALKPIVDYQAVFIPDEPKVAGQILPTFAYRDVDKVQFLGTSAWHSPELITRAQDYAEGVTFTDAFFAESDSPKVKQFVTKFQTTFNQTPGVMEALAFDAAAVVEQALTSSPVNNRTELKNRLKNTSGFNGVTGKITYRGGRLDRDLSVLTVHDGKFVEAK